MHLDFCLYLYLSLLQKNQNFEKVAEVQLQINEVAAAKAAHVIQAKTTRKHMDEEVEKSKEKYKWVWLFRKRFVFTKGRKWRGLWRATWYLALTRMKFIFLADYQMVLLCISFHIDLCLHWFNRISCYLILATLLKLVLNFSATT